MIQLLAGPQGQSIEPLASRQFEPQSLQLSVGLVAGAAVDG